jgi:hypothetical protein
MRRYLDEHPDVFVAKGEPKFFATDLMSGSRRDQHAFVRSWERYSTLFAEAGSATRIGDRSGLYLYSTTAAAAIARDCPGARIIIMLRNPVDMMYAFHAERVKNGNEDIFDFAEALNAEEERRNGRRIPRNCIAPKALQYRAVARFAEQVERYYEVFGRDRVLVILFDDFAKATAREFARTLAFLDVDTSFAPEFKVVNASHQIRSPMLWKAIHQSPEVIRRAVRAVGARRALRARVRRWGLVKRPRPRLDDGLRKRLLEEFHGEIVRLEALIGQDLSHWRHNASPREAPGAGVKK